MNDSVIRTGSRIVVIGGGLGHDLAPWRDNQRMAIGAATIRMRSALGSGNDEAAGFDGTRTKQNMPMRLAAVEGEGRRNGQHFRTVLSKAAIEMREAQIVTDRQPHIHAAALGAHHFIARREIAGLTIALSIANIGVEHMNLVVMRPNFAVGTDKQVPVDVSSIRPEEEHRPDGQLDPASCSGIAQPVQNRAFAHRFRLIGKRGPVGSKEGGSLWKADQLCAVICRPVDQRHQRVKCLLGCAGGAILQRGNSDGVASGGHAASSLSRWPAFSSA